MVYVFVMKKPILIPLISCSVLLGCHDSAPSERTHTQLNTVLEQKVLAGMEQKTYTDMLDEIGAVLYAADKSQFTPEYYGMISMRLTEMKEYEDVERIFNRMSRYIEIIELYKNKI